MLADPDTPAAMKTALERRPCMFWNSALLGEGDIPSIDTGDISLAQQG